MTTTESENFYRVVSLLIDAGTDVMRRLFSKYATSTGAPSVYNFLCNEQAQIFKLQKSKHLKSHQVALLLGQNPGTGVDINTWDINLLCVLLKVFPSFFFFFFFFVFFVCFGLPCLYRR